MGKKLLHFSTPTAFILLSPPLAGKKEFFYSWAAEGLKTGEPVCFISTDASAEDVKKDLVARKIFFGQYENKGLLKFIDCYSHNADEFLPDAASIRRVSGPLALNEISIALAEIEREFLNLNEKHRIIFNSISTLLMYCPAEAVGRFVQVLISKIKRAGGSVLFTLEEGMHEQRVVVALEHLMDGIIRIKKERDKILLKTSGVADSEQWVVFKGVGR